VSDTACGSCACLQDLATVGYSLAKLGLRPPSTWLRRYCALLLKSKAGLYHNKKLLTQVWLHWGGVEGGPRSGASDMRLWGIYAGRCCVMLLDLRAGLYHNKKLLTQVWHKIKAVLAQRYLQ
jgi:hypothetical protein